MKKNIYLILKFTASYQDGEGSGKVWDYYAKLYPTGTLRVFDPAFPSRDCDDKHYFNVKVQNFPTNKGNRYIDIDLIRAAFYDVAVRECFFPFRDLHFGYSDPFYPEVEVYVKFDPGQYEVPVQVKSNLTENWIQAVSRSKILVVDALGQHKTLRDE